jgi:DNA transposition AAA+ family ATPase
MRKVLAKVKNLVELNKAFQTLGDQSTSEPHMGLIHGFAGAGKTKSITWLLNQLPTYSEYRGVAVSAQAVWTVSAMLKELLHNVGVEPVHSNVKNMSMLCKQVEEDKCALFVDEADYLFDGRDKRMLETLRDVHDKTGMPVVLVGMDGIERKLNNLRQLDRRVTQRVRFGAIDLNDAKLLAATCCEVLVEDDLIERVYHWAKGSIAMATVGLTEIERQAKLQNLQSIDSDFWGEKSFRRGE